MTTTPSPQPTCCRDALFNWAIHFDVPGDLSADAAPLPDLCNTCHVRYASR